MLLLYKVKRTAALLLAVCVLLSALAGCGGGAEDGDGNTDPGKPDRIGTVPSGTDFGGGTFTMLCRKNNAWGAWENELTADGSSADVVDRAVCQRNKTVEDALGVSIKTVAIPGYGTDAESFVSAFRNSVMSGTGEYDATVGQQGRMNDPALAGLLTDINGVPYIKDDLGSDCFNSGLRDELTVNGRLYYLTGDLTVSSLELASVLFFNRPMAEEVKADDLFQLVRDGEWTADKMMEISRGIYRDLNNNGAGDAGDVFGYITDYEYTADALCSNFDVQPTGKDAQGNVIISVDRGKAVSVLEKMEAFFGTRDVYTFRSTGSMAASEKPLNDIFASGRALFYPDVLSLARGYRSSNTDFGILPYPKWDEDQEGYYTQSHSEYSVVVIPADAPDPAMSGAVLDALFTESSELVIPAFYDSVLKKGAARDDESGEMLDIIKDGIRLNFGTFHPIGMSNVMRVMLARGDDNFVTYYAVHAREFEGALREILADFYGVE